MKVVRDIGKMKIYSRIKKKDGKTVGFVPSMGCLHEGHISLIKNARKQNDVVVLSIFVNPAQFGKNEDFSKYPRDFEKDEEIAKTEGVDIIFYPSEKEIYPKEYSTFVNVEALTGNLCGKSRPGHFKGVTTIVCKLFHVINPDMVYFGQKDFQQAVVIKKMIVDLNMDIILKVLPIVREADGLAMSSRNSYLSKKERNDAAVLHKSLRRARDLFSEGEKDANSIRSSMKDIINSKESVSIDYLKIVDPIWLRDIKTIQNKALVCIAANIGKIRLIDNTVLGDHENQ